MNELPPDLRDQINSIPGDERWWNRSSRDDFEYTAKAMLSLGMTPEEIYEHLHRLYYAVADCYGG